MGFYFCTAGWGNTSALPGPHTSSVSPSDLCKNSWLKCGENLTLIISRTQTSCVPGRSVCLGKGFDEFAWEFRAIARSLKVCALPRAPQEGRSGAEIQPSLCFSKLAPVFPQVKGTPFSNLKRRVM